MHNLYIQPVLLNQNSYITPVKRQDKTSNVLREDNSEKLLKTLDCMSAVSFGSFNSKITNPVVKGLEELMASEIPVDYDVYKFLLRYPVGFYKQYGLDVNKFLRSGGFKPLPEIRDDVSDSTRRYLANKIEEQKNLNRTIYESIGILDSTMSSRTTAPMLVYRDAPKSWMLTQKDGYLMDKAFCSVSLEKGASMEGFINNGANNFTYEIYLPENTPFLDLTDTSELEMVLPRDCRFKVLRPGILQLDL